MADHPSALSHSFLRADQIGIHSQGLPVFGSCLTGDGVVECQIQNEDYYIPSVDHEQQQHHHDPHLHHGASYESLEEHRSPYAYYATYGYPYYTTAENGGFATVGVPAGNSNTTSIDLQMKIDVNMAAYMQRPLASTTPVFHSHQQANALAAPCGSVGLPLAPEHWPGETSSDGVSRIKGVEIEQQSRLNVQSQSHNDLRTGFDWPPQIQTNPPIPGSLSSYHFGQTESSAIKSYERPSSEQRDIDTADAKSNSIRQLRSKGKKEYDGGEEPAPKYQCLLCAKQYCRRSTLKTHLRHHSGERPYFCGVCGKSFAQAANLTAHRRIHTGEKPFACPICCRPFSQSSSLVTHKRTHTGEKPYQCPRCDKAFTDSSTLTKHVRTHTGVKPYTCAICLLSFSQSGNLNRHMKTHLKQQQGQ